MCKFNKCMFGVKPFLRCWDSTIDGYLQESGFIQSKADPCIYFKDAGGEAPNYLGVYADGIIIAAKSNLQLQQVTVNLGPPDHKYGAPSVTLRQ